MEASYADCAREARPPALLRGSEVGAPQDEDDAGPVEDKEVNCRPTSISGRDVELELDAARTRVGSTAHGASLEKTPWSPPLEDARRRPVPEAETLPPPVMMR